MNHKFRREYYVCNEQKNDRGCSGNYFGNVSECGAVLTDGSTLGTLGGAAGGGVIGHQVGK